MKKVKLASIVVGVLILVGMMSGVVAQTEEPVQPTQKETITIPDYENFAFRQPMFNIDLDKDGNPDYVMKVCVRQVEQKELTD